MLLRNESYLEFYHLRLELKYETIQSVQFISNYSDVIVREFRKLHNEDSTNTADRKTNEVYDTSDTGNDEVIANLLQAQFNQEYNTILNKREEKFNRDSKGNNFALFFGYMIIFDIECFSYYFSKYLIQ